MYAIRSYYEEASINIGQEVPVLSGSQTTSGDNVFNTVDRKTVGTKLTVTPQINEGDSVLLEIQQEVSSVADAASSSRITSYNVCYTKLLRNQSFLPWGVGTSTSSSTSFFSRARAMGESMEM